jgi:hypothetical protein
VHSGSRSNCCTRASRPCSASCGPRTCSYQAGYPEEPAVSRGRRGGLEAEHHLVLRLHPSLVPICLSSRVNTRSQTCWTEIKPGRADGARRLLRTGRAVELAVVRQAVALHRPPGTDRTSDVKSHRQGGGSRCCCKHAMSSRCCMENNIGWQFLSVPSHFAFLLSVQCSESACSIGQLHHGAGTMPSAVSSAALFATCDAGRPTGVWSIPVSATSRPRKLIPQSPSSAMHGWFDHCGGAQS